MAILQYFLKLQLPRYMGIETIAEQEQRNHFDIATSSLYGDWNPHPRKFAAAGVLIATSSLYGDWNGCSFSHSYS